MNLKNAHEEETTNSMITEGIDDTKNKEKKAEHSHLSDFKNSNIFGKIRIILSNVVSAIIFFVAVIAIVTVVKKIKEFGEPEKVDPDNLYHIVDSEGNPLKSGDAMELGEVTLDDNGNLVDNGLSQIPISVNQVRMQQNLYDEYYVEFDVSTSFDFDIENLVMAVMAWDSYGLPLNIEFYNLVENGHQENTYWRQTTISNIPKFREATGNISLPLQDIKYLLIYPVSVSDFEGNIWDNPGVDYYMNNIAGKKLNYESGAFEMEVNNEN